MINHYASAYGMPLILATLFLSLTLEFVPWPGWLVKPLFLDMALVYWVVHRPRMINYTAAVVLGVMMDLAAWLPLGFTALSYTAMVTLLNLMRWRFSLLGMVSKAVHVFFVLACGQFVLFMLGLLENGLWSQLSWSYFAPAATTAVLWLFMPLFLEIFGGLFRRWREEE